MQITIANKISITDISDEVLNYINLNLVIANPEYEKKRRMGFWMGKTPQKLYLYERVGKDYILPYGCLGDICNNYIVKGRDSFVNGFRTAPKVDYGDADVPLYDYQKPAVDRMYTQGFGILQAPAGSGKTQMGIALAIRHSKRCLWVTHTQDLLNQSYDRAAKYVDTNKLGTITEGKVNIGECMTFATVQTLCRCDLQEMKHYWDVIIVDECHRVAGTPTQLSMFGTVLSSLCARHKYGLSATLHRADGLIKATYAYLGRVQYAVSEEDVADKIMKVGIQPIATGIPMNMDWLEADGMINHTKLVTELTECRERNEIIIKTLIDNKEYSSLILTDRIAHLETLISMLPEDMQKDAVMITGKMTSKKAKEMRKQAIADMQSGKKKYLFATFSLAKEGLDIPRLERVYFTTIQKDYAVVTQAIGRVARTCEGKADPICMDFIDNFSYSLKAYKKRWTSYRKIGCYEVK